MGGGQYHVFRVAKELNEFTYYSEERNEANFQCEPPCESLQMTFAEFHALHRSAVAGECEFCHYLQTPLLQWDSAHGGPPDVNPGLRDSLVSDLSELNMEVLQSLADAWHLETPYMAQLFCSGQGAYSPLHYDQLQNVYLQVTGTKRFLLFSPSDSYCFYPYPVHHPLDRKARTDLGLSPAAAARAWPQLEDARGRGLEVLLRPGDVLFIPSHWWHCVQSLERENVSLNVWFTCSDALTNPDRLAPSLHAARLLELARHAELFLSEQCSAARVGATLLKAADGEDLAPPASEDRPRRWEAFGYVAARFCELLGVRGAAKAWRLLSPRRWQGLQVKPPGSSPPPASDLGSPYERCD